MAYLAMDIQAIYSENLETSCYRNYIGFHIDYDTHFVNIFNHHSYPSGNRYPLLPPGALAGGCIRSPMRYGDLTTLTASTASLLP